MAPRSPAETGGGSAVRGVLSSAAVDDGGAARVADAVAAGLADDAAEPISGEAGVRVGNGRAGLDTAGADAPLSMTGPMINPPVTAMMAATAVTEANPQSPRRPDRTRPPRMPPSSSPATRSCLVARVGT